MPALNSAAADRPADRPLREELAVRRPHWPPFNRGLLITAAVFLAAALVVTLLVQLGTFRGFDRHVLTYLQNRGSAGQDAALGLLTYLGGIEVTLALALLVGLALFKGLRLLAIGPAVIVVLATGMEWLGKTMVHQVGPPLSAQRWPDFLPKLTHGGPPYSFPSGHVLRSVIIYGLILYLAERWELFGKDSSRLSPVLALLVVLIGYAVLYLGWHWFADALGGALLGLAILIGAIAFLERRRLVKA
ncbi:MAG TPA: phosphatase PAP2 family protein [Candidatus Limnocylindrales bacterium]|nr:phosphatase PAP2 family protein [Candidatus Limnocylindrales bacterium]